MISQVVTAAAISVALYGCGGGDSPDSTASTAKPDEEKPTTTKATTTEKVPNGQTFPDVSATVTASGTMKVEFSGQTMDGTIKITQKGADASQEVSFPVMKQELIATCKDDEMTQHVHVSGQVRMCYSVSGDTSCEVAAANFFGDVSGATKTDATECPCDVEGECDEWTMGSDAAARRGAFRPPTPTMEPPSVGLQAGGAERTVYFKKDSSEVVAVKTVLSSETQLECYESWDTEAEIEDSTFEMPASWGACDDDPLGMESSVTV